MRLHGGQVASKRIRDGNGKAAYKRQRNRLLNQVRRNHLVCWICGGDIDVTLDRRDPMSFTADHVQPLSEGGHLVRNELRPAHMRCNSRRGNTPDMDIEDWDAS